MMPFLEQCLYLLSNAMLFPTLIAIVGLAAWMAMLLGGLLREWLARNHVRAVLQRVRRLAHADDTTPGQLLQAIASCQAGLPARLSRMMPRWPEPAERDKCLEDLEFEAAAHLAHLAWITRIAPMLGLMGTLIPLGPALTGLASGDIAQLSSNLIVAFTATVVGVFLGCAAFTMNLLRKNWYARDLSELEYVFSQFERKTQP